MLIIGGMQRFNAQQPETTQTLPDRKRKGIQRLFAFHRKDLSTEIWKESSNVMKTSQMEIKSWVSHVAHIWTRTAGA